MAISDLVYQRVWTNREQFPTYEGSEDQVRLDLQYHPDAIKNFINDTLLPALNALIEGGYAPGAVDTAAIAPNAVTQAKLSTVEDEAGAAVGTNQIINGAVTLLKMAANSVDNAQLVNGAVTLLKMAIDSVGTAQIIDGNVTAAKLGTDVVPESVGFVVGTGDPMTDPTLISEGQVYLKLES